MHENESKILPIVEMKHIKKHFPGVVALNDVSFTLLPGEVHALVGENGSGKSTLIKILSGVYQEEEGELYISGKYKKLKDPEDAQSSGIATIHQEINLIPNMDVASNMFLNREPLTRYKLVNFEEMYRLTGETLREIDTNINPKTLVSQLSVAEQQLVEIAKALTQNMIVLVLDEPTASLPASDAEELFRIIERLKKNRNVGIIYVSHRLEEIERLADRVTVIRDGQVIATKNMSEVSIDEIIRLMVGREVKQMQRANFSAKSEEVLKVEGLSAQGLFKNDKFQLKRGEILGIAGLVGSGRSELVAALSGSSPAEEGKVYVHGVECKINSPSIALANGIGFLPAERKAEGLATLLNIRHNIIMASLQLLTRLGGILHKTKILEVMENFVTRLKIKISGFDQKVGQLSGGNQQKIVLAKVLARGSEILIFDEPTRGIDVGTRREIYELLDQLASSKNSIIISSSDLPELLGICDRILAMYMGKAVGEFKHGVSKEEILRAILGQCESGKETSTGGLVCNEKGRMLKEKEADTGWIKEILGIPFFIVAMSVFFGIKGQGFVSLYNLNNILNQLCILWLLATAQTFALITRGIDLSVGSIMALVGMVVGITGMATDNMVIGMIAGVGVGALCGLFNGAISGGLNVEPFIVTLGTMYMLRGAALVVNDGQPISGFPKWFSFIDQGYIGSIPFLVIITVVICIFSHIILDRTRFGRHMMAIGGNIEGARISGVKVDRGKCIGYVISGVLAGVVGIILASRLFSAQPTIGGSAYLEGMAAAVIGGVSFLGGRGNILALLKGVLVIGLLSNGLNILHVSTYTQFIFMGGVLVVAVIIDRLREIAAARQLKRSRKFIEV